ncbi:MAG: hypothetical protein WD824_15835 [Cyclobacteriaceae bacterium]
MKSFSKLHYSYEKATGRCLSITLNGVTFGESTTVKIPDQDVFDLEGALTEDSNLAIIRKLHRQVEDVICITYVSAMRSLQSNGSELSLTK